MPIINQLSSFAASQIAAGEVVERPSSLVKELLENSLDAGANKLKIIIDNAGAQRISVTDNGKGIEKEDLPLALARHATSKISSISDLASIESFGFRGEALASAAAVSRLTITSKHESSDKAWQLSTQDVTKEHEIRQARHEIGTTVDIHDLFFNTPARKLFMKSERTEFAQIDDLVKAFAIIRPDVSFELIHNQKVVRKLASIGDFSQLEPRLSTLLSKQFTNGIYYKEFYLGAAWLAHPSFSRSSSDFQWLFVNKRLVRDPGLTHAVKRAYQDVLMTGRHPAFIIAIDIAPDLIDINIHPNKKEIKFVNKEQVYKQIFYAVQTTLAAPPVIIKPKTMPQTVKIAAPQAIKIPEPVKPKPQPLPKLGHAIAQIKGIFIIAETANGIIIVDMHAAHERVLYQQLKQQYGAQGILKQKLLLPIPVIMTAVQFETIKQQMVIFNKFGFTVKINGDDIVLTEIPALLSKKDPAKLFESCVNEVMAKDPSSSVEQQINKILGTLGCHFAIRANRQLSIHEMNALLRQMEQTEFAQSCNHGRPTYKEISLSDLDAMFSRGK